MTSVLIDIELIRSRPGAFFAGPRAPALVAELAQGEALNHDPDVELAGTLSDWALWMRGDLAARTADWRAIAAFLTTVRADTGTRSTYRGHLRAFYRWLVVDGQRPDNPVDRLPKEKPVRRKPRPITTAQLAQLLGSGIYRRTRMRTSSTTAESRCSARAGTKPRSPSIPTSCTKPRGWASPSGYWFPSPVNPDQPITGKSASKVISAAMTRAGVPGPPHAMRHWYGTTLRREGADIRTVQGLMHHLSIRSTQMYTEVDDEEMREAIERLPVPLHAVGQRRPRTKNQPSA